MPSKTAKCKIKNNTLRRTRSEILSAIVQVVFDARAMVGYVSSARSVTTTAYLLASEMNSRCRNDRLREAVLAGVGQEQPIEGSAQFTRNQPVAGC